MESHAGTACAAVNRIKFMTPEEIQKQVADTIRKTADAIDPKLNQASQPPKPETAEAAQEAHESAEVSFQTKRVGKTNVSLNSQDTKTDDE